MRTNMSNSGRPASYTVRKAAWILGVAPSSLHRAIRVGAVRTEQRNGRQVIPASELSRLLGSPLDTDSDQQAGGAK
ncbi:helix-turn-helix domain-containing protein [Saccharopolyspora taberi]|uniref:Helix-turn-helix domain-containing protein n=1 Tax=Saccharopolyspora taberi TaxID=60895 RepID=A0ABN3VIC3_9PSEU